MSASESDLASDLKFDLFPQREQDSGQRLRRLSSGHARNPSLLPFWCLSNDDDAGIILDQLRHPT